MTYIEQAIKEAVEKGGFDWNNAKTRYSITTDSIPNAEFFLDPAFWQALGKSRGWEQLDLSNPPEDQDTYDEWKEQWHRFIDSLAEGKDAESFFKNLLEERV